MPEGQARGVHARSAEQGADAAVSAISEDGMSDLGELDADLVAPPRLEAHPKERRAVEPLLDLVVSSGKLKLADIAEMNPNFDIDGRTAAVAARVVARIANGVARGLG